MKNPLTRLENADRAFLVFLPILALAATLAWVNGMTWVAGLSAAIIGFVIITLPLEIWLRHVASHRLGPEPPADGSPARSLRYRWYHSPDSVVMSLAGMLFAFFWLSQAILLRESPIGVVVSRCGAGLFLAIAYASWRYSSPKQRERDQAEIDAVTPSRHKEP